MMDAENCRLLPWACANSLSRLRGLVSLVLTIAFTGCATPPPPKGGIAAGDEEKLVVGDIIAVKIQGVVEPPTYEGEIDDNGEIQMLYLNKVKVAGFTPRELEDKIKYEFVQKGIYPPTVLQNMIVTVSVATRSYYMTGEASRGKYPLAGGMTVCKALLASGSSGEFANLKKVIVHRGKQKILVNCIRAKSDPSFDVEIMPNDIIEVPKKGILPFL